MKKLIAFCSAAVLLMGFAGCENDVEDDYPSVNKLYAPTLVLGAFDHEQATVSWEAVPNAGSYAYMLNDGTALSTGQTSVTLTGLTPETHYTLKVKSVAREGALYFEDSDYVSVEFTTQPTPDVPPAAKAYRIKTFADDWDTWTYEYNDDGTVKRISRPDREWVFAYDGVNVTTTGKNAYRMTLNEQGLVATFLPEEGKEYTYTYDDEGYMIQARLNGEVVSNIVVEGGNIVKWSRWSKAGDETEDTEHFKLHTYSAAEKNVTGVHCIYSEAMGASRWLVETGLFGKASAYCHTLNVWDYNEGNPDNSSIFTFVFDPVSRGIAEEHKLYGTDTEKFFYTYEEYTE